MKKNIIKINKSLFVYLVTVTISFVLFALILQIEPLFNNLIKLSRSTPYSLMYDWHTIILLLIIFPVLVVYYLKNRQVETKIIKDTVKFDLNINLIGKIKITVNIISVILSSISVVANFFLSGIGASWQNYYSFLGKNYTIAAWYLIIITFFINYFAFSNVFSILFQYIVSIVVILKKEVSDKDNVEKKIKYLRDFLSYTYFHISNNTGTLLFIFALSQFSTIYYGFSYFVLQSMYKTANSAFITPFYIFLMTFGIIFFFIIAWTPRYFFIYLTRKKLSKKLKKKKVEFEINSDFKVQFKLTLLSVVSLFISVFGMLEGVIF